MPTELVTRAELVTRRGRIALSETTGQPWVLFVHASGYVGPRLIRQDLAHAAAFGASHPEGWWYVVDPTTVIPNPVNIVYLRRVGRLPNVRGYVVIARRQPMRFVGRLVSALGGPDQVVASAGEALSVVAREHALVR